MAIVYLHRRNNIENSIDNIFYIGIGISEKRACSKQGRNLHWKRIVNKYGFTIEILYNDLTWEEACQKEIELIKLYGRKDLGLGNLVNLTDGGDGQLGCFPNKESRKKKSISIKKALESQEVRKKMGDRQLGEKNHRFGKHLSKEEKENLSNFHKGEKNSMYGKRHSIELIEQIQNSRKTSLSRLIEMNKGSNNPMFGKKLSEDRKREISNFHKGKTVSEETRKKMSDSQLKRYQHAN
ncbi:MAG: NUMOD3 domain-containing DNA-binding protein [Candidatus Riflemargulisbacteria bacterium]